MNPAVDAAPSRSNLRRFLDLSAGDQHLLIEAWWRLLGARVRLQWGARGALASAFGAPVQSLDRGSPEATAPQLALAVSRAAAHHLGAMTCLPRALALRAMLARRGIESSLRIGVRREAATIAAHAWVEVAGSPLGEPEEIEARFAPLLPHSALPNSAVPRE